MNKDLEKAMKYLSYKPRTEKEMIVYLQEKNVEDEKIHMVIDFLKSRKYIDDIQYVKDYVSYAVLKKRGRYRIEMELTKKGIKKYDIEDGIYEYEDEEGISLRDIEYENIKLEIAKYKTEGEPIDKKTKDKIVRRLSYLGYDISSILKHF